MLCSRSLIFCTLLVSFLGTSAWSAHADTKREVAFGLKQDQARAKVATYLFDHELNSKIADIGNRLVRASGRTDLNFTFRVINDPLINAYATAGGFVYLNSGLLDFAESSDELAGVIAHEIAHNNEAHVLKRMDDYKVANVFTAFMSEALPTALGLVVGKYVSPRIDSDQAFQNRQNAGQLGGVLGGILTQVSSDLFYNGYPKALETEADELGIKMMVAAGFDGYAMIRFLKRMKRAKFGGKYPEGKLETALFNKNPGLQLRIDTLEKLLSGSTSK